MVVSSQHDCKKEFKSVYLKATPARLGVLRLLEKSSNPVDVQTMISYLQNSNIATDPATVFRIVNILSQKGLIHPIQFNEGKTRYEVSSKGDHHHLICESCGKIEDISDYVVPKLEKEIKKGKKFLVKRHSLEFFGICKQCQH